MKFNRITYHVPLAICAFLLTIIFEFPLTQPAEAAKSLIVNNLESRKLTDPIMGLGEKIFPGLPVSIIPASQRKPHGKQTVVLQLDTNVYDVCMIKFPGKDGRRNSVILSADSIATIKGREHLFVMVNGKMMAFELKKGTKLSK